MGKPLTPVERIWAHLTVKQLTDEYHATSSQGNKTDFQELALELANSYSLVTDVTDIVVVKPDNTNTIINIVDASHGISPEPINDTPMCKDVTS